MTDEPETLLGALKRRLGLTKPPPQHPIFVEFHRRRALARRARAPDFVGAWSRPVFNNTAPSTAPLVPYELRHMQPIPPVDEEYFEWVDMLLAVCDARDTFTVIELGAGYGRWGVRAALAAKALGIPKVLAGFAEAEPTHCAWLRNHTRDNGLAPEETVFWDCAVSDVAGEAVFYTAMPEGSANNDPAGWYGQALAKDFERPADPEETETTTVRFASGWAGVRVPVRPVSDLLAGLGTVDLIDMDVKGEELKIVSGGIEALTEQVKRLHIGTHNAEVEDGLRAILRQQGWICVWDYPGGSQHRTPFGDVNFGDGVQGWVNPGCGGTVLFPEHIHGALTKKQTGRAVNADARRSEQEGNRAAELAKRIGAMRPIPGALDGAAWRLAYDGAQLVIEGTTAAVLTAPLAWSYAAALPLNAVAIAPGEFIVELDLELEAGAAYATLASADLERIGEQVPIPEGLGTVRLHAPKGSGLTQVLLRNGSRAEATRIVVAGARCLQ